METISSSKAKSLKVVLDGPCGTGKSVLLHRLVSGEFRMVPATIHSTYECKHFEVDGTEFRIEIWDLNGLESSVFEENRFIYRDADIIIAFFDICRPETLESVILTRIPYFHAFPTPILLVGLKSDLRQDSSKANLPLFPYEFGPWLAHLVDAVKYMECSAKTNQCVLEVFEEAIRACYENRNYCGIVNDTANDLLLSTITMNAKWKYIIKSIITSVFENYDFCIDFIRYGMILWSPDQQRMATGTVSELIKFASVIKNNIFLKFAKENCSSITDFFGASGSISVKSLVIVSCVGTLNLDFLSALEGLHNLIVIDTAVDLSKLSFSPKVIASLKRLILNKCHTHIRKLPAVIGTLSQLEVLDVTCSSLKILPESLSLLDHLRTLRCNHDQIVFPPKNVLQKSAQYVVQFLKAFYEEKATITTYREAKIMVLGQEGVGKSTLVKSLQRTYWIFNTKPPSKTDGVDISVLHLPNYDCRVYDLAGDVEYHNTHALFFSPYCLHLAVFDLSHFIVSKGIRSNDLFSRLELWLQTIACQDPNSYAIIVGTHMDHSMLSPEVLTKLRDSLKLLLDRYRQIHLATLDKLDECLLCNNLSTDQHEDILEKSAEDVDIVQTSNVTQSTESDVPPEEFTDQQSGAHDISPRESNENRIGATEVHPKDSNDIRPEATEVLSEENKIGLEEADDQSSIPHILGIFEVSGVTNKNVRKLKCQLQNSIQKIKLDTNSEHIPRKWLSFRNSVKIELSQSEELVKQPILKVSQVYNLAYESEVLDPSAITAMLRFFHAQGDFLWYEDFPVMKDVVILDPQWLSNQLRTLISHLPHVNAVCEGVLHHSKLPEIWSDMTKENRSRLITLFRNVGLCFSVSKMEDLFPCKLPVGWPDREMWPSLPDEGQTSLLFSFSFLPPSFFPDLIVSINEKRASFPSSVDPLYYRFNVVYITIDEQWCPRHHEERLMQIVDKTDSVNRKQEPLVSHRIHFELMPYKNTMKVTIRGPRPCCMIPDVESTIELVKSRRYPGMTHNERVVCPECDMKKLHNPSSFAFDDSHEGFCKKGHKVGSIYNILAGKMSSSGLIPSAVLQAGRIIGEVLDDHYCPKLFAVLPINLSSLSLKDRFVYSYLRDGYGVHLLCEAPEEWHFLSSPGFRVGKPKEFFKTHGGRVCKLLRVISSLGAPFQIASAIDPHCKTGVTAATGAEKMRKDLKDLLEDYLEKYPHLKSSLGSPKDDLTDLKSSGGLSRTELSRFLEVAAKGRDFGPLTCTHVDKCNEWLWLCEEHNQKYAIVER